MTAADLDITPGDQLQDRYNAAKWRTVISVTDARPGRVWILYTDGLCQIEDVADLIDLTEAAA